MMIGEVFVVDDEPGIRLLLSEVIRRANYNVMNFDRSDQALKAALTKPPRIIFLDYLIDPLRGDEVINQLNEASIDVPVVLMSGMAAQEVRQKLGEVEVYDVIEKPFSITDINQILEKLSVRI